MEDRRGIVRHFIGSMLKVGLIGFGGGNALIPIIQQAAVDEYAVLTPDEYEEDVVVASITPGALPVEIAGGIGRRCMGNCGLLIGAMAMALPGVIFTVLLAAVMSKLNSGVLLQIQYLAVGITAFICFLLTQYIVKTVCSEKDRKWQIHKWIVIIGVFLLTGGKNIFRILSIERTPLFSVSTIHIFILAFFLLAYAGNGDSRERLPIAVGLSILFLLCKGKGGLIESRKVEFLVGASMAALAVYGICRSFDHPCSIDRTGANALFRELFWLVAAAGVMGAAAVLVTNKSLYYLWNGIVSSLTSFGGGDAYLTVADGLFVQTGLIGEDDFYGYLVPVVNILPGSILCKTLSGVGYFLGYQQDRQVWEGVVVAAAGFFVSLLASCGIFDIVRCFYSAFREMPFIQGIRKWIRPIVSGLMLTVILSLIYQNVKLGVSADLGMAPVLLMAGIFLMDLVLAFRLHLKNGTMAFLSALVAFVICNMMGGL